MRENQPVWSENGIAPEKAHVGSPKTIKRARDDQTRKVWSENGIGPEKTHAGSPKTIKRARFGLKTVSALKRHPPLRTKKHPAGNQ